MPKPPLNPMQRQTLIADMREREAELDIYERLALKQLIHQDKAYMRQIAWNARHPGEHNKRVNEHNKKKRREAGKPERVPPDPARNNEIYCKILKHVRDNPGCILPNVMDCINIKQAKRNVKNADWR